MFRRFLCTVTFLAVGALSCGDLSGIVPAEHSPASVDVALSEPAETERERDIAMAANYLGRRRSGLSQSEIRTVAETIVSESHRYGFDPILVLAVIHIESRGNAFALSPVGAIGMMQIMPATGEELAWELGIPWTGPQTLFRPVVNIQMGVAYLKQLEERFGELSTALAAYNWGPGTIDRRIQRGAALPARYSGMVLAAYSEREMQQPTIETYGSYRN